MVIYNRKKKIYIKNRNTYRRKSAERATASKAGSLRVIGRITTEEATVAEHRDAPWMVAKNHIRSTESAGILSGS